MVCNNKLKVLPVLAHIIRKMSLILDLCELKLNLYITENERISE